MQGAFVQKVEELLAEYLSVKHAILVANGTASLHLCLLAASVGPGDEVLIPAFSYVATANVVELVGAKPVFVDIDLNTFNIQSGNLIKYCTDSTRAIIPVHEFGCPAEMSSIKDFAMEHNLFVLEDAACALGAQYQGNMVGSIGDAGSFSFHPRKAITSGEGGLVVTDNDDLAAFVRSMRNHGRSADALTLEFVNAGFNYRLTDIQAALLEPQVRRIELVLAERVRIAERYNAAWGNSPILHTPNPQIPGRHAWQSYHILFESRQKRNAFVDYLKKQGVQSGAGAQCIPTEPYYKNKYGYDSSMYPNATRAHECGAVVPLYNGMSEEYQQKVIDTVEGYIGSVK